MTLCMLSSPSHSFYPTSTYTLSFCRARQSQAKPKSHLNSNIIACSQRCCRVRGRFRGGYVFGLRLRLDQSGHLDLSLSDLFKISFTTLKISYLLGLMRTVFLQPRPGLGAVLVIREKPSASPRASMNDSHSSAHEDEHGQ
ncbi:hypothetical protein AG1IA_05491 [Rhizoctonia solani AG-1 IA]|uniref:Uncharacterized protein n=1 Tax=Thanatephorus cucumeris (strain AG1-IA) TaxID=983506 RepID=L8WUN6_THACA|nr:hypothetical protein AG1IA_05491 [Rhizoctonia solani AG-1 IA]